MYRLFTPTISLRSLTVPKHQFNFMPLRTANSVERNVSAVPTNPITLVANTSAIVLPDVSTDRNEYSARYIQWTGSGVMYYAFNQSEVDTTNWTGQLQQYQQLDCSNHSGAVVAMSPNGGQVGVTLLRRNDNSFGAGGGNVGGITGGGIL